MENTAKTETQADSTPVGDDDDKEPLDPSGKAEKQAYQPPNSK